MLSSSFVQNEGEESDDEMFSIVRVCGKRKLLNFSPACLLLGTPKHALHAVKKYHLSYKFVKTESKLVRNILTAHGFKESNASSTYFNLLWTGSHLKPYTLRGLTEHQKVNHFPRSYELTRKDYLYKNIQRMQLTKGIRHFEFIPKSFILPVELNQFYNVFLKDRGPWIVKPCASSRGRGIYLINNIDDIPLDEHVLVCKYINNPLLVNGFKFDCRIYVAVTSYDPLRIYIYKEGLARFSTVKYESDHMNIHNQMMHLTNYSINKISDQYIRCDDPEIDDYGSKWSFSGMLRFLSHKGFDTRGMMMRIEDLIIKTIISGEMAIATACKMFVPHRGNCFELFGFDILVDDNLKPWLLEVNLSPSLACDSPLDLKIKVNLMSDLFNLAGFVVGESVTRQKPGKRRQTASQPPPTESTSLNGDGLNTDERRLLRETRDEYKRRGGFVRVYPSPESWQNYGFLQEHQTPYNRIIHCKLYPELWRQTSARPKSATYMARAKNFSTLSSTSLILRNGTGSVEQSFVRRYMCYEKKLQAWSSFESTETLTSDDGDSQQPMKLTQGCLERNVSAKRSRAMSDVEIKQVIKQGHKLKKLQARHAFSGYLQRVKDRLHKEVNSSSSRHTERNNTTEDKQIDLIERFLHKATVNLSNPIKLFETSSLALLERKNVLVRQLNEFIRVYTRETFLLSDEDEKTKQDDISNETFQTFLTCASESDLEGLLTMYTKHNKSASVFLGSTPAKTSAHENNADPLFTKSDQLHTNRAEQPSKEPSKTNSFTALRSPVVHKPPERPWSTTVRPQQCVLVNEEIRRHNSANSTLRSKCDVSTEKQRMRNTILIYTGCGNALKQEKVQTSLSKLRSKQSKQKLRCPTTDLEEPLDNLYREIEENERALEKLLRYGDRLIKTRETATVKSREKSAGKPREKNKKKEVTEKSSLVVEKGVSFNEPHPPPGRPRPETKRKIVRVRK